MGENPDFPTLPDLTEIDFTSTADVGVLVKERFHHLFGPRDDAYIDEYMDAIEDLFAGRYPEYQAMDTAYHDITHTLQASLCLVELIHNRHFSEATPRLDVDDFRRALVAVLFHDIGYLKKEDDTQGSGAKYTHLHEQRSCEFSRTFLARQGWSSEDIQFVEHLIGSTGPSADVREIAFNSDMERQLGQAICTADYVGQMSDPNYPARLEILFNEFAESYEFQNIPQEEWPFASFQDLLVSTPDFWEFFVKKKLNVECADVWKHLQHPLSGKNPYMDAIDQNLARVGQMISGLQN